MCLLSAPTSLPLLGLRGNGDVDVDDGAWLLLPDIHPAGAGGSCEVSAAAAAGTTERCCFIPSSPPPFPALAVGVGVCLAWIGWLLLPSGSQPNAGSTASFTCPQGQLDWWGGSAASFLLTQTATTLTQNVPCTIADVVGALGRSKEDSEFGRLNLAPF